VSPGLASLIKACINEVESEGSGGEANPSDKEKDSTDNNKTKTKAVTAALGLFPNNLCEIDITHFSFTHQHSVLLS
jgi:hypothetical protein